MTEQDTMATPDAARDTSLEAALQSALARRAAPRRPGAISNATMFGWRALLKIKHVPEQLFDVVITPVMFTVMFTYLFGGALAGSTVDYLQFLLPGILAQTVIFTTIYTGVTLNTDISKGIYDRFKSMPIWAPSPLVGAMLGDFLRYTGSSVIVVLIGLLMGFRPEAGLSGVIWSMMLLNLFAFGIGWIFTTLGLLMRTPGTVMTISWIVLMPLTFASNVFVDPATMPGWLQSVVNANPVSHLVTAIRALMAGTANLGLLVKSLLMPAAITVIFAPLAMVLYHRPR
ncbi:MAG: ABC transporter permease [Natronospirillum sp.]|uniref:ABC transporter permease n=1 Tax=Natronospirillum sp. TaxID=2812955 RepID=UPI0025E51A76|nr:ABC transporter permease [Natronospirillum sp.]MCH8552010.1 ABC transporter permease [Natronospirillum sp.]